MNSTKYFLKQSSIYNNLEVESIISEDFRDNLSLVSKKIIYLVVVLLLILYFFDFSGKFIDLKYILDFFIPRLAGVILVNLGIIIFSKLAHFYLGSKYYFERIVENKYSKDELYTFSAGRVLYEGMSTDVLHGFLKSKIGRDIISKLGIKNHDRKVFYKSTRILTNEDVPKSSGEILKLKDVVNQLYTGRETFRVFLNRSNITDKELLEATDKVVDEIEKKEYESEWWRKEFLLKKPGFADHI